jgi:spore coat protein U-like protein
MKKFLVVSAAMMMVLAMVSGAMAQSPTTLDVGVSATVNARCVVTGGTLAFGDLEAGGGDKADIAASGISIKCTNGTSVAVTDNDGVDADNTMTSGSNELPYSTSYTSSLTGAGTGVSSTDLATTLAFKGTVLEADYALVPAGAYTDTIVLTLTY